MCVCALCGALCGRQSRCIKHTVLVYWLAVTSSHRARRILWYRLYQEVGSREVVGPVRAVITVAARCSPSLCFAMGRREPF